MVSLDKSCFAFACDEIKTSGNFKLAGMLNFKLKEKAAFAAKQGIKHVHVSILIGFINVMARAALSFLRMMRKILRRQSPDRAETHQSP